MTKNKKPGLGLPDLFPALWPAEQTHGDVFTEEIIMSEKKITDSTSDAETPEAQSI